MIKVFTSNGCMRCEIVKKFFATENLTIEEINISRQPSGAELLKSAGHQSVPVTQFPNMELKDAIIGLDMPELRKAVSELKDNGD